MCRPCTPQSPHPPDLLPQQDGDLASELPSRLESCDAYANGDNSRLTGELEMLIQEMGLLIASNVFEIARSVKKSCSLQKSGGKSYKNH